MIFLLNVSILISFNNIRRFFLVMISREVDYAIRVILFLMEQDDDFAVLSTSLLAEEMGIPYSFLRLIIRKLAVAGLIKSIRGSGGGVQLQADRENISLLTVINAVDPKTVKLTTCLIHKNKCPRTVQCLIHNSLTDLQKLIDSELNKIRFNELVEGGK